MFDHDSPHVHWRERRVHGFKLSVTRGNLTLRTARPVFSNPLYPPLKHQYLSFPQLLSPQTKVQLIFHAPPLSLSQLFRLDPACRVVDGDPTETTNWRWTTLRVRMGIRNRIRMGIKAIIVKAAKTELVTTPSYGSATTRVTRFHHHGGSNL